MAANGQLAGPPFESIALLMLLAADEDEDVRGAAESTLGRLPVPWASGLIARTDAPVEIREYFVGRGIAVAAVALPDPIEWPQFDEEPADTSEDLEDKVQQTSAVQRIAAMGIPERIKTALRGTRELRSILIRDPNKLVALTVLRSPKLTESEIESIARMGSVDADVLRTISLTRAWMKNYPIVLALTKNPKTPLAVSLPLLRRLNDGDLRRLSADRNIPDALRVAARKKVVFDGK